MLYVFITMCTVQALIALYLYKRIRLIEQLLIDVLIDIKVYEQVKIQKKSERNRKSAKRITTVGNWKK